MPLSDDPDKREKQLANLRQSEGALKHGVASERKLRPLRDAHRADLLQRFPGIDDARLSLLSGLLARCDLARDYIDVHGLMRNTRQTHPVLELLTRWERRAWEMLTQLQPKASPGEWDRDTPILQFELTAAERIGLRAADAKTQTDVAHQILRRLSAERSRGGATSLRHTSLNAMEKGRPPEKLNAGDLSDQDVELLDDLNRQAAAEQKPRSTPRRRKRDAGR